VWSQRSFVERSRLTAAGVLLLVLAACLASQLRPAEVASRWRLLERSLSRGSLSATDGTAFWFDPDYAAFVEDLKRHLPENASVAVIIPSQPDVYLYRVAYELAPRRVVDRKFAGEADYIATYRAEMTSSAPGRRISHGTLLER
jgi:hypothetical protein